MTKLATDVISRLQCKTLCTAESCTGGLIGGALTAVSGASNVYKGGIVSYTNEVKHKLLGVDADLLEREGAVSAPVEFGNPVGTVFIGYADETVATSRHFLFNGDRESVRAQAVDAALKLILEYNQ